MTITKEVMEQLGAKVEGTPGDGAATLQPTGLKKTKFGLIAPQSSFAGDTRTGKLQSEAEEPPVVEVPQEVPAAVQQPQSKRRKKKQQEEPAVVRTTLTTMGVSVPTAYSHLYRGAGIVVLGVTELSFLPEPAQSDGEGNFKNVVAFSDWPDSRYIYCGNWFVDGSGRRNIVLIEIQEIEK